ncbi:MAG: hypothetical protein NTV73_01485 [Hyphomicrobiales bacterium]|nr:hypothetical protein [Hyphomicrobiales bacterium]
MNAVKSRWTAVLAITLTYGASPVMAQTGSDDTAAAALVADQVREQGIACTEPTTAGRDPSVYDDAVWLLTCADGKYRVRLVPDQAAVIETLN